MKTGKILLGAIATFTLVIGSHLNVFAGEDQLNEMDQFMSPEQVEIAQQEMNEQLQRLEAVNNKSEDFKVNLTIKDVFIDENKEPITISGNRDSEIDIISNYESMMVMDLLFNPREIVNGTLTSASPQDLLFFSVTQDTLMLSDLNSTNGNYVAWLHMVDFGTGQAFPTNIILGANSGGFLINVPQGDFAFVILSLDGVGQDYTFRINATNPTGNIQDIRIIEEGFNFLVQYTNFDMYGNGTFIANPINPGNTSHFEWNWVNQQSIPNGFIQRTQSIYSVVIDHTETDLSDLWSLELVSYRTPRVSSDSAILIELDIGSGFTFFESFYQNIGGVVNRWMNWDDVVFGRRTPRALDASDFMTDWDGTRHLRHVLVFDLNTGETIDLWSLLRVPYATPEIEVLDRVE